MSDFIIIENDNGLAVIDVSADETSEQAAVTNGGVVADAGPYHSYEDAYDAMQALPDPNDEL